MQEEQKKHVHAYWNRASCGTELTNHEKFSPAYFQDIESARYRLEPEIFSFAQFTRYHNKKVLEVGVGAGTDFTQWVRAGAHAYGIDLTEEAIENTRTRLALEELNPTFLQVADAELLPFEDNFFDLSYSWGVIHHSPRTFDCLSELIRVTKPGGSIKIMIYNLNSLFAFYQYCIHGIKKGRPFSRWKDILYHHQESFGTRAFTKKEICTHLQQYPVIITKLDAPITSHDLLYYKAQPFRIIAHLLATICGWKRAGWFMLIELKKYEL